MQYLQGIQTAAPIYNGEITGPVRAYCDADYGTDEDRKSISDYFFLFASAAISWQAKKQIMVAESTVKSEYAGLTHTAKG